MFYCLKPREIYVEYKCCIESNLKLTFTNSILALVIKKKFKLILLMQVES